MALVSQHIPKQTHQDKQRALHLAAQHLLSKGIPPAAHLQMHLPRSRSAVSCLVLTYTLMAHFLLRSAVSSQCWNAITFTLPAAIVTDLPVTS